MRCKGELIWIYAPGTTLIFPDRPLDSLTVKAKVYPAEVEISGKWKDTKRNSRRYDFHFDLQKKRMTERGEWGAWSLSQTTTHVFNGTGTYERTSEQITLKGLYHEHGDSMGIHVRLRLKRGADAPTPATFQECVDAAAIAARI